jgi:hypothetical protein
MGRIVARLTELGAQLVGIEERLDRIGGVPERWLVVEVVLVALLIVAQVGTPFLNAALIHLAPYVGSLTHSFTPS